MTGSLPAFECSMEFKKASEIFDLYIDWDRRLEREIPYLLSRLKKDGFTRVADVACGKGVHAVTLAAARFEVTAFDADPDLCVRARELARERGAALVVEEASFHELPGRWARSFDAVLCLGNSISLVEQGDALERAVEGLSGLLRPGGMLLLHTINYPMLSLRPEQPWGPVRTLGDNSILLKGFVPHDEGPWDVLFILLERMNGTAWTRQVVRFQVHPHGIEALKSAAEKRGVIIKTRHGGFAGESCDDPKSADLLYEFVLEDG